MSSDTRETVAACALHIQTGTINRYNSWTLLVSGSVLYLSLFLGELALTSKCPLPFFRLLFDIKIQFGWWLQGSVFWHKTDFFFFISSEEEMFVFYIFKSFLEEVLVLPLYKRGIPDRKGRKLPFTILYSRSSFVLSVFIWLPVNWNKWQDFASGQLITSGHSQSTFLVSLLQLMAVQLWNTQFTQSPSSVVSMPILQALNFSVWFFQTFLLVL